MLHLRIFLTHLTVLQRYHVDFTRFATQIFYFRRKFEIPIEYKTAFRQAMSSVGLALGSRLIINILSRRVSGKRPQSMGNRMSLENNKLAEIEASMPNVDLKAGRRAFLQGVGLGAAGLATAGLALSSAPAVAAPPSDIQILNFALNLEYLESEFYLRAATGSGLSPSDRGGNPGTVIGGRKVAFSSAINAAYATELANEEQTHVRFLRSAIASAGFVPASAPNIDLTNSFTTAAMAAGLIGPGQTFDAFANDTNFLLASYIFEDVGVTAYHGALTSLNNKTYLDKAAGIMATEAYHAGIVRTALFVLGLADATNAISILRQKLTGAFGTPTQGNDHGVGNTSAATILDADGDAIAWERTVPQVLNVVYGNTSNGATPGLFFPNGISAAP